MPPSKLKVNPVVDDVIFIVPVATVQVGCTVLTVGAVGVGGWAFTVTLVTDEIQPSLFLAVSVCDPATTV